MWGDRIFRRSFLQLSKEFHLHTWPWFLFGSEWFRCLVADKATGLMITYCSHPTLQWDSVRPAHSGSDYSVSCPDSVKFLSSPGYFSTNFTWSYGWSSRLNTRPTHSTLMSWSWCLTFKSWSGRYSTAYVSVLRWEWNCFLCGTPLTFF